MSILILAATLLFTPSLRAEVWATDTAAVQAAGQGVVGVFQPLRYGLRDDLELSTHTWGNLVLPGLGLKKSWHRGEHWSVATRHGLSYPSCMLLTLAREGVPGILPADSVVPQLISLSSEGLFTRSLGSNHALTARVRADLTAPLGAMDVPTLDLPVAFSRMASWYGYWSVRGGLGLDGRLLGQLDYQLDLDLFVLPFEDARLAFEQRAVLAWRAREHFSVQGGVMSVWGQYPYGTGWRLLPLVDLQWGFGGG